MNDQPFNSQKGDNHCFPQCCLLIGTVSRVIDVSTRPLVFVFFFFWGGGQLHEIDTLAK